MTHGADRKVVSEDLGGGGVWERNPKNTNYGKKE